MIQTSTPPRSTAPSESRGILRGDWITALLLTLALIGLKWVYHTSQPFNSDEPQHAHIVWAWATGKLQYKEVFDNHTPLFHALYAPFFACFDERADIVRLLRLGMIPLFLASLWATYRLGAIHYSKRAGFWAATLLAAWPPFFLKMNEFRTDVLWTTIWLFALLGLTAKPLTRKRCFWIGVLFGVAFAVSMKTIMLLVLMGLAALTVNGLARWAKAPAPAAVSKREWGIRFLYGVAGALVLPLMVVAYFAAHGALNEMYYCVFVHSSKIGISFKKVIHNIFLDAVGLWLVPSIGVAVASVKRNWFQADAEGTRKRLFLVYASLYFCPLLVGVWMIPTSQGFLPWYPLMAVVLAPLLIRLADKLRLVPVLALILAGFIAIMVNAVPLSFSNRSDVAMIQEAITLTEPHEYLLDPKGETVYRNRPYYFVFETFTKRRLKDGTLNGSDLIKDLVNTRTAVIRASSRYPEQWAKFLEENYVRVGELNVLGKRLDLDAQGRGRVEIVIPERYSAVLPDNGYQVQLNGEPLDPSKPLEAGTYEVQIAPAPTGAVYLLWSRAVEKGFKPKVKQGKRPKSDVKTFIDYVRDYIR